MQILRSQQFQKQFRKLRLSQKIQKIIKDFFSTLNDSKAKQIPYYKGTLNMFKKFSYKDLRIIFAYCRECYPNHRDKIECSICNKDELDRIILFGIYARKKMYRNLTPEKISKGI